MTFPNFDLYFHMANHYRKIKEAKSVVDCSSPEGYSKNTCNSRQVSNAPQFNNLQHSPCASRKPRNYSPNCRLPSPSHTPLGYHHQRCYSAPTYKKPDLKDWKSSQNKCRKNFDVVGTKIQPILTDCSKPPIRTAPKTKPPQKQLLANKEKEFCAQVKPTKPPVKCVPQESEYVHFLLKITEDILRNDFYTEEGMEKLFESYIAANKQRLKESRMRAEIGKLKKELNLPLPARQCACSKDCNPSSRDKMTNFPETNMSEIKPIPEVEIKPIPEVEIIPEESKTDAQPSLSPLKENQACECLESPETKHEEKDEEVKEVEMIQSENVSRSKELINPDLRKKINITPNAEEFILSEDDILDCVDPTQCCKSGTTDEVNTIKEGSLSPLVTTSMVKIRTRDQDENEETEIMMYTPQDANETCSCTVALQRTALKIQVDNENEEYILVDGPVCMPRSMLENKTIPVLVQNISSIVLNNIKTANDQYDTEPSGINLLQVTSYADTSEVNYHLDSISGHLRKSMAETDCDLTPEREITEEVAMTEAQKFAAAVRESLEKNVLDIPIELETKEDNLQVEAARSNSMQNVEQISKEQEENVAETIENVEENTLENLGDEKPEIRLDNDAPTQPVQCAQSHANGKCKPSCTKVETQCRGVQNLITSTDAIKKTPSEALTISNASDFAKYHYLLADASTSMSDYEIHSKRSSSASATPIIPSKRIEISPVTHSVDLSQTLVEYPKEPYALLYDSEDYQEPTAEFQRLIDDDAYNVEQFDESHSSSLDDGKISEESFSKIDSEFEEEEVPERKRSLLNELSPPDMSKQELLIHPLLEKIPKIQPKLSPPQNPEEITSLRQPRASILAGTHNLPLGTSETSNKAHEGHKVRYSLNLSNLPNLQNFAIINQLDQLPDVQKEKADPVTAMNAKMKEFRTIDDDDGMNKRFQVSNEDKFEIRRVPMGEMEEKKFEDKNKDKTKSMCCGLGQPGKSKRKGGSFSSDYLR